VIVSRYVRQEQSREIEHGLGVACSLAFSKTRHFSSLKELYMDSPIRSIADMRSAV
jgi:hypothetical protein